jgi:hypothetical protein
VQDFFREGGFEAEIGEELLPEKMGLFLCGSDALIGVPSSNRETRQKVYPKDPATGQEGLIEILETRYGFTLDPMAKSSGERGNIHFERWY